jgi:putative PIN family toxin of toxin-antitoxin system
VVKAKNPVIRVVLDTNVLVSALLFGGEPDRIVAGWKCASIVPVLSKATFDEFRRVLSYPRFALNEPEINALIEDEMLPYVEVVETGEEIKGICRDPSDDIFLTCAAAARVAAIVSGDKDLLALSCFNGIPILTVHSFLKEYGI